MNVHDWHRNGLRPAFATVEQWIHDLLGYVGAEDEACFAIELRDDNDRRGLAVRILIASDKGFFDMTWERPDDVAGRVLQTRHYRWAEVRGVRLIGETRLDPETLTHRAPAFGLEIDTPEVRIERAEESVALLELWKSCDSELKKAAKG